MKRVIVCALPIGILLSGCTSSQVLKIQTASANFKQSVAYINSDIAAASPLVASACADLQKWAMLIQPFIPDKGKAQQYFDAANGALVGYCQVVPTDINSTATAIAQAAMRARNGYYQVNK